MSSRNIFKKEDETIWHAAEWGRQIIFSHGSEHSRGICILVKPNGYPLETIESEEGGQYIFGNLKLTTEKLFIVNVYATPTATADYKLISCKTSPIS